MIAFVELTSIPRIDKEPNRSTQGIDGRGKISGSTVKWGKVIAQFGIVVLHRIGLAFVDDCLMRPDVDARQVEIEGIAEVLGCPHTRIQQGLQGIGAALPDNRHSDNAAGRTVNRRHQVGRLFFSTKVKSSSTSMVSTSVGTGAAGNWTT